MKTFKASENESSSGSSLQGYVTIGFNKLVEIFGIPNSEGDNYKVSTEWCVEDENGKIATIYDYKETDLYDSDNLSVDEFRNLPEYEWHIGCDCPEFALDLAEFIQSKVN